MPAAEKMARAKRLRALRERLGLSQSDVAERVTDDDTFNRTYVSKCEGGSNAMSSLLTQRRLSQGLGVPLPALSQYLDGVLDLDAAVMAATAPVQDEEDGAEVLRCVREMARLQGFDPSFAAQWNPGLTADPETAWTLCKADYVRFTRSRVAGGER